jgi:hypothetical protein
VSGVTTQDTTYVINNNYGQLGSIIAGIRIVGGSLLYVKNNAWSGIAASIPVTGANISILVDVIGKSYSVYVNGVVVGQSSVVVDMTAGVKSVQVKSNAGGAKIDYISTRGSGPEIFGSQYASAALAGCKENDARDFIAVPANTPFSSDLRYPNIKEWCKRTHELDTKNYKYDWCDYDALKDAIKLNPVCYDEAYGYCVGVTFVKSNGFEEGGSDVEVAGVKQQMLASTSGASLDGASACNLALGASVGYNKVAKPLLGLTFGWLANWKNLLWAGVALIIFLIILSMRRRPGR